jgi:hypothetical protein
MAIISPPWVAAGRTTDVIHSDATQLLSWESSG